MKALRWIIAVAAMAFVLPAQAATTHTNHLSHIGRDG